MSLVSLPQIPRRPLKPPEGRSFHVVPLNRQILPSWATAYTALAVAPQIPVNVLVVVCGPHRKMPASSSTLAETATEKVNVVAPWSFHCQVLEEETPNGVIASL